MSTRPSPHASAAVAAARELLNPRLEKIAALAQADEHHRIKGEELAAATAAHATSAADYGRCHAAACVDWRPAELAELGFAETSAHPTGTPRRRRKPEPSARSAPEAADPDPGEALDTITTGRPTKEADREDAAHLGAATG